MVTVPMILLQPPGICRQFTRSQSLYPPLGLCQLAAVLPEEDVRVIDAEAMEWSESRTMEEIEAAHPLVVGMTATSYTLDIVENYARLVKALGIEVIVGGPHASVAPEDLFERCPSVDLVVRGEGEAVIGPLLDALRTGTLTNLPGVCWRRQGGVHISPEIARISEFSSLPFPRLTGLPIERYWCPDAKNAPMVTMMTARGCPHRCGFCASPTIMGKKVRGWPVEGILRELERLHFQLGVQEISFVDDVFTIQKARALELCRGMTDRGLGLTWFCNARADQITPELAEAMAAAGCHQVYLGFESGSQEILDRIHKGTTVAQLERGAELLRAAGIHRSVGFVIGLPGENETSVRQSIELAHRVRPERLQFTRWTPLAGSPLFNDPPSSAGSGFHVRNSDQIGHWISMAYADCAGQSWGAESW